MPSNVKLLAGASGGEPTDANFKNVTLLLHGDGSNGAQNNTFIDSSTNNFTITRNGNTTQGSFSPYGSNWSNYFDGTGDYLTAPSNAAFGFGTNDYTVEAWVCPTSIPARENLVYCTDTTGGLTFYYNQTQVAIGRRATAVDLTATYTLPIGVWTHLAVSRQGGTTRIYVNGTQVASTTTSYNYPSGQAGVGDYPTIGNLGVIGYLSNVRVVTGTAVYTSAFTPPTQPLTAITNTSLLTCAYNRFRDGSTNNFTITRNGDVKVTNFAPFAPSSAYSTSANGGSSYYDGDTDYLSVPNSTEFVLNGTFTLEAWVYPTGDYSKFQCIITKRAGNTPAAWQLYIEINTGYLAYYNGSGYVSTSQVPLNQWSHVAGVYDGTNINLYLNGVRVLQSATTNTDQSTDVKIGYHFSSVAEPFKGYLTDVRVVKGGQVYSGTTYTVPTAPLTAISGTSLLVRATNAAIFDNSMKNDLETVGNAQISTSVKKFGTGSMYFDGSGDYLIRYQSSDLRMGSGNITVECWVYPTSKTGWRGIFHKGNNVNQSEYGLGWEDGVLTARLADNGSFEVTDTTTLNAWNHIAYVRNGTTFTVYINGVAQGTATSSTSFVSTQYSEPFIVGYYNFVGNLAYFQGYIDELRVTRGVARYTANFTAPTAPFPNK